MDKNVIKKAKVGIFGTKSGINTDWMDSEQNCYSTCDVDGNCEVYCDAPGNCYDSGPDGCDNTCDNDPGCDVY